MPSNRSYKIHNDSDQSYTYIGTVILYRGRRILTENNYIYRLVSERVRFQGIFLEAERILVQFIHFNDKREIGKSVYIPKL